MLLVPASAASKTFFSSGGIDYPLGKLKKASNPPSADDMKWVDLIVPALGTNRNAVPKMARYAIAWNDLYLWQRIMQHAIVDLKSPTTLIEGWRALTFDAVHFSWVFLALKTIALLYSFMSLFQFCTTVGQMSERPR